MRHLKVPFDAKLMHNIMNEEHGASLKLLHLLRQSLDRHFMQSDKTVSGLKKTLVDSKVKKVSDLAAKLPDIRKQYGVPEKSTKWNNY